MYTEQHYRISRRRVPLIGTNSAQAARCAGPHAARIRSLISRSTHARKQPVVAKSRTCPHAPRGNVPVFIAQSCVYPLVPQVLFKNNNPQIPAKTGKISIQKPSSWRSEFSTHFPQKELTHRISASPKDLLKHIDPQKDC